MYSAEGTVRIDCTVDNSVRLRSPLYSDSDEKNLEMRGGGIWWWGFLEKETRVGFEIWRMDHLGIY